MRTQKVYKRSIPWVMSVILLCAALILSACAPAPTAPPPPTPVPPTAVPATDTAVPPTATERPTSTSTPLPSPTSPPTSTPTPSGPPEPTANPSQPYEPISIVPLPQPGQPFIMATNNVNVRSGPGTNYPIYGSLPSGRSAILIGRSQDSGWFVISMNIVPLGQGWVSAQFATANGLNTVPVIAAPPVPPSADFGTVPGPNDPQATALVNTFVRSGPAPAFPAFGIAQPGRTALVIGKSADNKYWAVRVNPANIGIGFAWVDMPSVSAKNTANVPVITSPPPPPTVVVPTPPAGAATGTAMDYLNIRSGPGTNFPVLGTVAPGTTGEIIGKSADGQWWQFRVPVQFSSTGTGWASAGWVAASNTANVPVVASPPPPPVNPNPPPPPSSQCVIVSQSPVNGTTYRAGTQTQFTVTWTVRNTSGSDWNRETDIAFVGALNGVSFHQGPDLYDISNHVSAGGTYTFSITAVNPSAAGTYQENWAFVNGSTTLCPISIRIVVQ